MFFTPEIVSVAQIASASGSTIAGDAADKEVRGAGPIESAGAGDITFVDNPKYVKYLKTTEASAVFIQEQLVEQLPSHVIGLVHPEPYKAYSVALNLIFPAASRPQPVTGETGISPAAANNA